nr:aspartate/glutamate racemase family protein [Pseudomonas sp. NMI760_13]
MSYEGSAVYYRELNRGISQRLGGLHSAQVLLHSLDFQTIVDKQKAGEWAQAGSQLAEVARSLENAGADCVMICAVTMHLVADAVMAATSLSGAIRSSHQASAIEEYFRLCPRS